MLHRCKLKLNLHKHANIKIKQTLKDEGTRSTTPLSNTQPLIIYQHRHGVLKIPQNLQNTSPREPHEKQISGGIQVYVENYVNKHLLHNCYVCIYNLCTSGYMAWNGQLRNNALEKTCKQLRFILRHYSGICLGGLKVSF